MSDTPGADSEVNRILEPHALEITDTHGWVTVKIDPSDWRLCCEKAASELHIDYLASLTAVDYTEEFEVIVHLQSLSKGHKLVLKCRTNRDTPSLPTVHDIWAAANWHERETHEMFGIDFPGHPELIPLLLPEDWEGHPLRKDYVEPD